MTSVAHNTETRSANIKTRAILNKTNKRFRVIEKNPLGERGAKTLREYSPRLRVIKGEREREREGEARRYDDKSSALAESERPTRRQTPESPEPRVLASPLLRHGSLLGGVGERASPLQRARYPLLRGTAMPRYVRARTCYPAFQSRSGTRERCFVQW